MTDQPPIEFDFTNPVGRAEADQYLAGANMALDQALVPILARINIGRSANADRTEMAIALIAEFQDIALTPTVGRLLGVALHRLAIAQLDAPENWTFNSMMMPSGECEIRITLQPDRVAAGDAPWTQLREIAHAIRVHADTVEQQANPAARAGANRILGYCASCGQPITPLSGYQFGDRGPTHITCPKRGNQP